MTVGLGDFGCAHHQMYKAALAELPFLGRRTGIIAQNRRDTLSQCLRYGKHAKHNSESGAIRFHSILVGTVKLDLREFEWVKKSGHRDAEIPIFATLDAYEKRFGIWHDEAMPKTRKPRRLVAETFIGNGSPVETANTALIDQPWGAGVSITRCQSTVGQCYVVRGSAEWRQHHLTELGSCFAAGTLVHTKEGLKPIEEIRVGDWVMSQPEDSDMQHRSRRSKEEYTYRQVTKTFVHDPQPILEVTYFQPGVDSVKAPLRVTANHPIWSKGLGWTPAGQMKFGHTLAIGYFGNVIVGKVRQADQIARVYNIEVDEFHTYFVEPLGVWVHNKSLPTFRGTVET